MSQTALMAVAARLHLYLRRETNRVTDVVWMVANPEYAREVLRLVRQERVPEMDALAARFEELMPAAAAAPAAAAPADEEGERDLRHGRDYIGTLR